jgi:predicted nicotinamide N-methyase
VQDPNSEHLGTTVWDASIVLAKMFERGQRKGEFSRAKLAKARALELGAGMGLGGIALALMGVDVVITDVADVLPLLRRNCDINLGTGTVRMTCQCTDSHFMHRIMYRAHLCLWHQSLCAHTL